MRECVGALCAAPFVYFAILGSSFPVVCMWAFCFGTEGGLVFVVKPEAASLPQGWLLHLDCATTSRYFSSTSHALL